MRFKVKCFFASFLITALASPLVFAADEGESATIEEILVTARKREESLLDIPESITAISSTDIDRQNIKGLEDVGFLIPNLNLSMRADGFPNVSVRGLGSFGNTQGVGFYLDDVQVFGDASARFGDLQRIEVLKGPQGVLYGGSNIGGAVKYVSVRPNPDESTGRIKFLAGEQGITDTEISANLPMGENGWAMRIFGFDRQDDGYMTNPNTPRLNGGTGDQDPNAIAYDQSGHRLSLAGPIGNAKAYFAYRFNEYFGPVNQWTREKRKPLKYPAIFQGGINSWHDRETDSYTLELLWENDGYDVTARTSYTDTFSARYTDVDLMPEFILDLIRPESMEVTTAEITFTSTDDDRLQWIAGLYFSGFDEEMRSEQIWWDARVDAAGNISGPLGCAIGSPTCGGVWAGLVPTLAEEKDTLRLPFEMRNREKTHQAAFVNITYDMDNDWEIGLGGRIDKWENNTDNLDSGLSGSQGDTEFLPRISLTKNRPDGSIIYFTGSMGYEPGGYNLANFAGTSSLWGFEGEEAVQYEFGWKGRLMDGRASASFAAFMIDYDDRQIEFQAPDPGGAGIIEGILNAGDSEQYGMEFEISVKASDYLTVSASAGFIEAEWDGGTTLAGVDLSGKTPPVVPDNGATFSTSYLRPLANGSNFIFDFQISHNGKFEGLQAWDGVTNPSFTIAGLQMGLSRDNWEFMVNVENITDEDYYVDVQYLSNLYLLDDAGENIIIGTLGQPRLVTASINYYFQ